MHEIYRDRVARMMYTDRQTATAHEDRGTLAAIAEIEIVLELSFSKANRILARLATATMLLRPDVEPQLPDRTDHEATAAYREMIGKGRRYIETARAL